VIDTARAKKLATHFLPASEGVSQKLAVDMIRNGAKSARSGRSTTGPLRPMWPQVPHPAGRHASGPGQLRLDPLAGRRSTVPITHPLLVYTRVPSLVALSSSQSVRRGCGAALIRGRGTPNDSLGATCQLASSLEMSQPGPASSQACRPADGVSPTGAALAIVRADIAERSLMPSADTEIGVRAVVRRSKRRLRRSFVDQGSSLA